MAKSTAELDIFYDAVLDLLPDMKNRKAKVQLGEYKEDLLSFHPLSTIDNPTFKKFLEAAWELCDKQSVDSIKSELEKSYHNELKTLNSAVVLKNAVIAFVFLSDTARDQFRARKDKYQEALQKIALNRTSAAMSLNGEQSSYDLVPLERRSDAFGTWEIDKLFGHMKIYLLHPSGNDAKAFRAFPPLWRTSKEETKFQCQEKPRDDPIFKVTHAARNTLRQFVETELEITDKSQLDGIIDFLNKSRHIISVSDLMAVNDWTEFKASLPAHHEALKLACERNRRPPIEIAANKVDKRSKGELLGDWNKVKRFFFHEAEMSSDLAELSELDMEVLKTGFDEQRANKEFDGGPGTGKTELCKVIINKAGFFGLVPPLASSELNRPLVGETEKVVMAIFHRALYVPYMLCCIAIDEIDALVPIRNEKAGTHKVDVLSLLLSLLGGIKNVPNVFLIASTNRLNKIDEAFARRLEEKFYVGRLSPEQGFELMKKIDVGDAAHAIPSLLRTSFLQNPEMVTLFKLLITNFSGAAVTSLRSKLLKYYDLNKAATDLRDVLIKLCTKVANDYQIKFGGYCIPSIIQSSNLDALKSRLRASIREDDKNLLTGRILIDMRLGHLNVQFECLGGSLKELDLAKAIPVADGLANGNGYLPREIKFTSDLISFLLVLAIYLETPCFQLIDANMMLANSAFDQSASFEILMEKMIEFKEYANSMIMFDADTLVGISENMSDSSMSESLSYSIQNSEIWQKVVLHTFMSLQPGRTFKEHRWCVLISSSEFLINQFKKTAKFELSEKEKDLRERERTCVNCGLKYKEIDNRKDACSYHTKKLLTKVFNFGASSKSRDYRVEESKESLIKQAGEKGDAKMFDDYYYTCCMKRLNESDGCQQSFHTDKPSAQQRSRFASNW